VLITPWNLYNNPSVIHYTLETLGAFIGPLFGVLIADFYLVRHQHVVVDDLFTMRPDGRYFYARGVNPPAVIATVVGAAVAVIPVLVPHTVRGMYTAAEYTWFIGMSLALVTYGVLAPRSATTANSLRPRPEPEPAVVA
jgi:NCS1 family nucleobase:cation symporter-1